MDISYRSPFAIDDTDDSMDEEEFAAGSDENGHHDDHDDDDMSRRPSECDNDDSRALLSLERNIANLERSISHSKMKGNR